MPFMAPPNRGGDDRHLAQGGLKCRLPILSKERCEDEKAKHAVDDGRHRGQQFHGHTQWPPKPGGAGLGEEQCNAKGQGNCNEQRNGGAHDGAVDGDEGTKLFIDDVPLNAPDEPNTKLLKYRPGIKNQ